jgi:predicted N-acetyltransferase YhbS
MGQPRIDYLADHPEWAPLLADWHYQEWRTLMPEWSHAEAVAELRRHTERCRIPTTFVIIEDDRPLGSVSLLEADLDGWEHLTPWLASLYVVPRRRRQGLGKALLARALEEAVALGVAHVYLFTAGQQEYYERLGWSAWRRTEHAGQEVVIMRRTLGGAG